MKAEIKLPQTIEVDDYHEFSYLERYFQQLNKSIKVKEVGFCVPYYLGIAYVGNLKDKKNAALLKEIEQATADSYDEE